MNWYRREPTLEEILADSIVRAVMEADGVDPDALEAMLKGVSPHEQLTLYRPGLQSKGGVPEYPFQLGRPREGGVHALAQR